MDNGRTDGRRDERADEAEFIGSFRLKLWVQYNIFCPTIKMQNLLKSELRLTAKNRKICGYKSMSKNELTNAINILKPTKNNKNNIFKSKRKEIKESIMKPSKKKIFKSITKEIKEIVLDPIIHRDEKMEEIKKNIFDPRNNLFLKKIFLIQEIIFLKKKTIIISQ